MWSVPHSEKRNITLLPSSTWSWGPITMSWPWTIPRPAVSRPTWNAAGRRAATGHPSGSGRPPARRLRYQRTTSTPPATAKAIPNASRSPFQGCILERLPAEVPEQRRVQGPDERRNGIEQGEAAPREERCPRGERDGGPPARYETGDGDQLSPAHCELALGPVDGLPRLIAVKEALLRAGAEAAADQIRGVVAEKRATGSGGDDQRQVEATGSGHHARSDHRRLARHHRHERVEEGEEEDDAVCPPRRIGDEPRELTEHSYHRTDATAACSERPSPGTGSRR